MTAHTEDDAEQDPVQDGAALFKPGGAFFHDVPDTPPALWGEGGDVLWAEGEALIITGPQGIGKTTLMHQLVRARLGLQDDVLSYPVRPGNRVLLLAMDRPAQTRRAGHRIFAKDEPAYLNEHLVVWEGPPPYDMAKNTDILALMCARAGAGTVVVDSIKDAAVGLSDDVVGAGYNRARQKALAEGVQILESHHLVKRGPNGAPPNTLADVYGSTWITSGAGSVVLLWGEAGDPIVTFRHLKQPMHEVGPLRLSHDHAAGVTDLQHSTDLLALVQATGTSGLTAQRAAEEMFEAKTPTRAQKEKARRKLDKLTDSGHLTRIDGARGRGDSGRPTVYFLAVRSPGE